MSEHIKLHTIVTPEWSGMRLDQIAALAYVQYSRSRLKTWIEQGDLTVDGEQLRPKDKLYGGELLVLDTVLVSQDKWQAEPMSLDLVYEDEAILVLNKPAGLVVHPAAGHQKGTLLNALLHHSPQLDKVPRAGLVHRLDKDTTGLMVVAKTITAHSDLVAQLQDRSMGREYEAVVQGVLTGGGRIDASLGRHPHNRLQIAVVVAGKSAVTHYRVVQRYTKHTHVRLKLETGRTHQIRVHMAHIKYPLLGDQLYGGRARLPKGCSPELMQTLQQFRRQALHAKCLQLVHPVSHESMEWEIPLPEDMQRLLDHLQQEASDTNYNSEP